MLSSEEFEPTHRYPFTGAFADVYRCSWQGNQLVALKRFRYQPKIPEMEMLEREAAVGFQLRHPNIVKVYGITKINENSLGIIMEWADLGTLAQNMHDMTRREKAQASLCICNGLEQILLTFFVSG